MKTKAMFNESATAFPARRQHEHISNWGLSVPQEKVLWLCRADSHFAGHDDKLVAFVMSSQVQAWSSQILFRSNSVV